MPIESICQECGQKLRVADQHAGKMARCPRCSHIYRVPEGENASGSATLPEDTPSPTVVPRAAPEAAAHKSDRWMLRTADGKTYGPVPRAELDSWAAEGRVPSNAHVQQVGSEQWQPAAELYPGLGDRAASSNPFADTANPYAGPATAHPTATAAGVPTGYYRPHRGGTILALGLIGLVCCQLLGPVAWAMGQSDLNEMKAGRMDPGGHGTTLAGMIMGIIGTVLLVISFAVQILAIGA